MIITITGRACSGKDTVLKMLRLPGNYQILDADALGHECLAEPSIVKQLSEVFPGCISAGAVDRAKLAKRVFPNRVKELNCIVHPCIKMRLKEKMTPNTIIHAALLSELGLISLSDVIVLVESHHDIATVRAKYRFHRKDFIKRLKAQKSLPWYRRHADHRIVNNGSLSELQKDVDQLCQTLF